MIILATRNLHKLQEVRDILGPHVGEQQIEVAPEDAGEAVEDGTTFAQNAKLKALHVARALGVPALADDSGLCVDIMGQAPGIFSARWSGHHGDDAANLRLLLNQLADVHDEDRGARFVSAAVLALPDGRTWVEEGQLVGRLIREPIGENGFGYDPIFVPKGYDVTTAQMTPEQKNSISHRHQAFEALAPIVARVIGHAS